MWSKLHPKWSSVRQTQLKSNAGETKLNPRSLLSQTQSKTIAVYAKLNPRRLSCTLNSTQDCCGIHKAQPMGVVAVLTQLKQKVLLCKPNATQLYFCLRPTEPIDVAVFARLNPRLFHPALCSKYLLCRAPLPTQCQGNWLNFLKDVFRDRSPNFDKLYSLPGSLFSK